MSDQRQLRAVVDDEDDVETGFPWLMLLVPEREGVSSELGAVINIGDPVLVALWGLHW